jgi:hypothetical protein
MSAHSMVTCTIQTETEPLSATVESGASPQHDAHVSDEKRVDPAESLVSPPTDLRQRLLRLILDRESQRKTQRSE